MAELIRRLRTVLAEQRRGMALEYAESYLGQEEVERLLRRAKRPARR